MPSNNLAKHNARRYKQQSRLTFEATEPSSSTGMLTPAKVRYEAPSSSRRVKGANFSFQVPSPRQLSDDADSFPSGKKFAVVVEASPGRTKISQPLFTDRQSHTPTGGKQTQRVDISEDSELDIIPISRGRQRILEGKPSPFGVDLPKPDGYQDLSSLPAGVPSLSKPKPSFTSKRGFGYDGEMDSEDGSPPEEVDSAPQRKRAKKNESTPIVIQDVDSDDSLLESPPRAALKGGKAILSLSQHTPPNKDEPKNKEKKFNARNFIKGGNSHIEPTITKQSSGSRSDKSVESRRLEFSSRKRSQPETTKMTPSKTPSKSTRAKKSKPIMLSDDEGTYSEEPLALITPRGTQGSTGRRRHRILSDDEDLDRDPPTSTRSSQSRRKMIELPSRTVKTDNDSDEDLPDIPNIRTSSAQRRQRILIRPESETDSDYDDGDPVLLSPAKRNRRIASISDDEDEPSPAKRSRSNREKETALSDEDEDEDDVPRRTSKGKGKAKAPTPKRLTRQQEQQNRKPHRTEIQKKLELLKRRRAGEKIDKLTSSESSEEEVQRGIYDSDSEVDALAEFDDESDNEIDRVRESIRASNHNTYDEDFVVDDEDVPLGVPTLGLHDIPLQFTHAAHKHLKDHFKDVVEWLVQKKINPAFARDDPVYKQAFRKIDDEVHGYASSKFTSSAWTKSFTRAIWARPTFYQQELSAVDRENHEQQKCGACNRSGHPATWMIQLGDHPYHKDTLEEIEKRDDSASSSEDDEEADSSDSSSSSINSNGQTIPKESKVWYVGRFCKSNAEIAHNLIHWKYALNNWVIDRLKEEGYLEAEKLAEREPWSEKKRRMYANNIVDGWETAGDINGLYKSFKRNLEEARDKKQNRFRA